MSYNSRAGGRSPDPSEEPPAPPPRSVVAQPADHTATYIDELKHHIANLVIEKEHFRNQAAESSQASVALQRLVGKHCTSRLPLDADASSSSPLPLPRDELLVEQDTVIAQRLVQEDLLAQYDEFTSALATMQSATERLESEMSSAVQREAERAQVLADEVRALKDERDALKQRIADDVLLKSQRNRIEMAARRISAPRVAREAGLRRIEAAERNAMMAHDDLYYVRRDVASKFPVFNVTLVLQTFSGLDILKDQSPEMVAFVVGVFQSTLEAHAARRKGYGVAMWEHFACYAFQSPSAALAFAGACHEELHSFCWPDTVEFCPPFRSEVVAKVVVGKDKPPQHLKAHCGPRLHTYLHYSTPCSDVSAVSGRLFYFGNEVNVAVSALAYLVRPGEICANDAWAAAMVRAATASVSGVDSQAAAACAATTSAACDILRRNGYDCEVLTQLPRILVVTSTEPVRKSVFAEVPPPLPHPLAVHSLVSILPARLQHRRGLLTDDQRLATTDSLVAFLVLASRAINGRTFGPECVSGDMAVWVKQSVAASKHLLASGSAICSSEGASAAPLVTQSIGSAAHAKSRRSLQSDTASPHLVPSKVSQEGAGRGSSPSATSLSPPNRRSSTRTNLTSAAAQQQQQQPVAVTADAVPPPCPQSAPSPLLAFPFPPLVDVSASGSTASVSGREAKLFFKSKVYEKHARAYECAQMLREDAMLATNRRPLSLRDAPATYLTCDVANVRSFDDFDEVLFRQFLASYRAMVRHAADIHHAYLVACSDEDVFLFAFRDVADAFAFSSTVHLNFREQSLLDALTPDGATPLSSLSVPKLSASAVHIRCGIATATGQFCTGDEADDGSATCQSPAAAHSGYLCAAALPGETYVSNRSMKVFLSVRKNVFSLDYTVVHRGFRVYRGCGPYSAYIYSILPSKLGLGGRPPGSNTVKRSQSVAQRSASMVLASPMATSSASGLAVAPISGGAAASSQPNPKTASGFDITMTQSIASFVQIGADASGSVDFDKIADIVNSHRRKAVNAVTTSVASQRCVHQLLTARLRIEKMESLMMASHDAYVNPELLPAGVISPPIPVPPTSSQRQLAVLYVDVEGSAKLFEACGDSFVRSQQHYNYLVRELVASFDGYVFRTNGTEAWIVAFRDARVAVEAAIALQQALLSADWPADITRQDRALRVRETKSTPNVLLFCGLRARVGIAVGAAQAQPVGNRVDYVGAAVTEAVRLGRSAHGGDTWLSVEAYDEVDNSEKQISCHTMGSILRTLHVRSIVDSRGETIAIACMPLSLEGRASRFPQVDRLNKISQLIEKDVGSWWKQPHTVGVKNECCRLVAGGKKKSISSAAGSGGDTASGLSGGPAATTAAFLIDRLTAVDAVISAPTTTGGPLSSSNRSDRAAPRSADSGSPPLQHLASLVRGVLAVLQAGTGAVSAETGMKIVDDCCRHLGALTPAATTPTAKAVKGAQTLQNPKPPTEAASSSSSGRNRASRTVTNAGKT